MPTRTDLGLDAISEAALPPDLNRWARIWAGERSPDNPVPRRAAITLQKLGNLAKSVLIFERQGEKAYKIRLAGSEVEVWLEHSLTGTDPLTMVPEQQRNRVSVAYSNVLEQPCGFYIVEAVMLSRGKQAKVSALKLPLLDNKGKLRLFLTAYNFSEATFQETNTETSPATHQQVFRFGYIDIGFGLPE